MISNTVKDKFSKVNFSINQHAQEFDRIATRHIKNEPKPFQVKNEILGALVTDYQTVVDKSAENGTKKAVPGTYLKMDCKIIPMI